MASSKKKSEISLMSESKTKSPTCIRMHHPGANHPVHSTQTIWCVQSLLHVLLLLLLLLAEDLVNFFMILNRSSNFLKKYEIVQK